MAFNLVEPLWSLVKMVVGSLVRPSHNHNSEPTSVDTKVIHRWLKKITVLSEPFRKINRVRKHVKSGTKFEK